MENTESVSVKSAAPMAFGCVNRIALVVYGLFLVFSLLALRYQFLLLSYREWMDESETIVAAKMMASGLRLYSEVFNHHGPLTFLSGLIVETIGDFSVRGHRVPIAIMQILAIVAIYRSPVARGGVARVCLAVAAAVVMLFFMPDIFGHMYKYQTVAGLLLVIILSQYTIPAIYSPNLLGRSWVVVGSLMIASIPFLAITYLPISAVLFLASLRKEYAKLAVTGLVVGVVLNVGFLAVYGSFPGYMAFHIYLNARILPFYTGLAPGPQLIYKIAEVAASDAAHVIALAILIAAVAILSVVDRRGAWRPLFLAFGVLSLLMRGAFFHGMPFFYAISAVLIVPVAFAFEKFYRQSAWVGLLFVSACVGAVSLAVLGDRRDLESRVVPVDTEFSLLVKEVTERDDRIIAYSFNNFEYLASGRLPASGHFFYLPWQAKYNEDPKFGVMIDACEQISLARPKVMLVDKLFLWEKFKWESYAGCVQEIVDEGYVQISGKPYYIRKDLWGDFERSGGMLRFKRDG